MYWQLEQLLGHLLEQGQLEQLLEQLLEAGISPV